MPPHVKQFRWGRRAGQATKRQRIRSIASALDLSFNRFRRRPFQPFRLGR